MNISPAERAAEFEGPASQPPLGTRQFATKSLDWTIPVQRMDILSRVTRNRVSPCDSTVKTRPSLVSPLFPPPALVSDVSREAISCRPHAYQISRGGIFFRCSRNSLRNHHRQRERKRERYLSTAEDSKIIREMKRSDENERRVLFQGLLFFFFLFKGK